MVKENLAKIQSTIPEGVTLVAVSKTKPNALIEECYEAGQRVFGENKVQELARKWEELPQDIQWHMIGHLQRNKVKFIAPFVSLIHSIDSFRLLAEVNKQANKHNRTIDCLLQFHIATETTKFGLSIEEASEFLTSEEYRQLKNIRIVGVMGMASFTSDEHQVEKEFKNLTSIFGQLKQKHFPEDPSFKEISMGMSGDYDLAIKNGSTMVRVGSSIFGLRN